MGNESYSRKSYKGVGHIMKIGISGSHGTGKSYTLYKLAHEYKVMYPNQEISVVTETARKSPLPINEIATIDSQL